MFKSALTLSSLLLAAALLTSCGKNEEVKTSQNVLRVNFSNNPATLDPRKGRELTASMIQSMLFEGLTRRSKTSEPECAIAESIDLTDDRLTYTFHLRDAFWSNGDPITAHDFEYTWKEMLKPSFPCPNANLLYIIQGAEEAKRGDISLDAVAISAADAKTFVVTLKQPCHYFLDLTAFCVFYPVNKKVAEAHANWADKVSPNFVSNGAFKLKKWVHDDQLIVEKNELFWDAEGVKLDGIHISLVADENTALSMYKQGELDLLGHPFSAIPVDALTELKAQGLLQTTPIGATEFIAFNTDTFPFNHKKMRLAFAYAINRKEIVENITQMNEQVANNYIPPILKKGKEVQFYKDADTDRARALFDEALEEIGCDKEAINLTLHYSISEVENKVVQAIQEQWRKTFDVNVSLEAVPFKSLLDRVTKRSYQMAKVRWVVQYNDQMNVFDRFKFKSNPKNYPGWENPQYVSLLDDAMACPEEKARFDIFETAEKLFIEEMPLVTLYHFNYVLMKQPHIDGLYVAPMGAIDFHRLEINRDNNTPDGA